MTDDPLQLQERVARLEQEIAARLARDNTLAVLMMQAANAMLELTLYLDRVYGKPHAVYAEDRAKLQSTISNLFENAKASIERP